MFLLFCPEGADPKKNLPPKVPITPMPRYSIMETPVLKKELDRSVSFWKARSEQTLPPVCVQAQRSGKQEGLLWGSALGSGGRSLWLVGAVRDSWLFTYCSSCDSGLRNMLLQVTRWGQASTCHVGGNGTLALMV